ncbi:MAG: serine hydrolase, partial [Acidobacteria bacterium]|nr:serine hydrolase [Acidobacteriota bacterium]
ADSWSGAAVIHAVAAGADIVLLPPDPVVAVQSLIRGVAEGQLTEERLDRSVTRILEAKARLGLQDKRIVDPEALGRFVARPEDLARAKEITESSLTLLRNEGGLIPFAAEEPLRLLHLVLASDRRERERLDAAGAALARRRVDVETHVLWPTMSEETLETIFRQAADSTHVVVSLFPKGRSSVVPRAQERLIRRLVEEGRNPIVLAFSSPYLLSEIPEVPAFLCAYGPLPSNQEAAVAALFGEVDVRGKLPVTLPGLYPYGHGLELARRKMTLEDLTEGASPEAAGVRPGGLEAVDRILEGFLEQKAFPGAVLAVGLRGKLIHLKAVGKLTYDEDARPVAPNTVYDLASLTKVVSTTLVILKLVERGDLDVQDHVHALLPGFARKGATARERRWRRTIRVEHLLRHNAGFPAWRPLYRRGRGLSGIVAAAAAVPLASRPGVKTLY